MEAIRYLSVMHSHEGVSTMKAIIFFAQAADRTSSVAFMLQAIADGHRVLENKFAVCHMMSAMELDLWNSDSDAMMIKAFSGMGFEAT